MGRDEGRDRNVFLRILSVCPLTGCRQSELKRRVRVELSGKYYTLDFDVIIYAEQHRIYPNL